MQSEGYEDDELDDELLKDIEWTPNSSNGGNVQNKPAGAAVENLSAQPKEAASREGLTENGQPTGLGGRPLPSLSRPSTPTRNHFPRLASSERPPRSSLPLSKPSNPE